MSTFSQGAHQKSKTEEEFQPQYQSTESSGQSYQEEGQNQILTRSKSNSVSSRGAPQNISRSQDLERRSPSPGFEPGPLSYSRNPTAQSDNGMRTTRSEFIHEGRETQPSFKKYTKEIYHKPPTKAYTLKEQQREKEKERERELNREKERERQRLLEKERLEEAERRRKEKRTDFDTYSVAFGKTDPYEKKEVSPDKLKTNNYIIDVPKKRRVETAKTQTYDPIRGVEIGQNSLKVPTQGAEVARKSSTKSEEIKTPKESIKIALPSNTNVQTTQGDSN